MLAVRPAQAQCPDKLGNDDAQGDYMELFEIA